MATEKKEIKAAAKPTHAERLAAFKETDTFQSLSTRDKLYYDRKPEGELSEWHKERLKESEEKAGA
ncbi:hypothetical protein PBC5_006 [Bacillus phage PBC5]|nr:hypothetical protein PBC5_006 [Bacillus phage PBC5]